MPFSTLDTANTVLLLLLGISVLAFFVVIIALTIYVGGKKSPYIVLYAIGLNGIAIYNILVISLASELAAWAYMIASIILVMVTIYALVDAEIAKRIR